MPEKIWEKYKNKGHGNRGGADHRSGRRPRPEIHAKHGTKEDLRKLLRSIDHRGYPTYKELTGQYDFGTYELWIDHVQGDPFAAPSSVSIHIDGEKAGFPDAYWKGDLYENRVALQDTLIRCFHKMTDQFTHRAGGSGKSGLIACSNPGQEILDRSACQINPENGNLIFRLSVGFPAAGRTVLAGELEKILFDFLPECVNRSLFYRNLNPEELKKVIDLAEDQTALRKQMEKLNLAAFVADGSILPRESGISQRPMKDAIAFHSPKEDEVEMTLPHRGKISGMGIPKGITLIIGGGYHGKSTLLQALERGVYNHIEGDGREFVLTDTTAVKIRAEDGRCVQKDNISMFIRNLPNGKDTAAFSTEDASGSTSQAAAVTEAVESGAKVLLMDEDTCATNFMVRDELMQKIVSPKDEPIIPYSQTMRPLYEEQGISTILVAGSSGAFFEAADHIIQMDHYLPEDVTKEVKDLLASEEKQNEVRMAEKKGQNEPETDGFVWDFSKRCPLPGREFSGKDGRVKHKNLGRDGFMIGHSNIDLRCVEQIADGEQTECLACLLLLASKDMNGRLSVQNLVRKRYEEIRRKGMAGCTEGRVPGNLALPRPQEFFAAINRCRALYIK